MSTHRVITGIETLLADARDLVANKRVGLVANPTSVTPNLQHDIDALRQAGVNLVALFGPEHGFAASIADGLHVASGIDARTGLPIHSLYGTTRKPTLEMLADVDILLFDLQDVGVRFYTYTATLGLTLEACAENNVKLIVLDRPNPITGVLVEGPILDPGLQSFVGHGPLPMRYGMTIGELAQFYNTELHIGAELQVIPLRNWKRAMWYDETGLLFVTPSPNIPQLATTIVYPGTCLIEGTNLSIGRGTQLPFEMAGAPWIDGYALAETMNALKLDGVLFRPTAFTPTASKLINENCFGVQFHVTDRESLRPVTMTLHLLRTLKQMYPTQFEFREQHFDRIQGDASVKTKIDQGATVESMMSEWKPAQDEYRTKRAKYLLYE